MMSSIQREISTIAYLKWNKGEKMKVRDLVKVLRKNGHRIGFNRGIYKIIAITHKNARAEGNQGIADCIACCYIKDDGSYAYEKK